MLAAAARPSDREEGVPGLFFEIAVPVEGDSLVVDGGHTFRVELGLRRLAFEMAKAVGTPDQHRGGLTEPAGRAWVGI
jgi:hypothetical protein